MRSRLLELLSLAQRRGFLGPGPVDDQLAHAEGFARLVGSPVGPFLDLGSGAGLPGLVFATTFPDLRGVLLDAHERRCEWLEEAVDTLGLAARISVVNARAEEAARVPSHRGAFELVTARSFASPPVTAECAVGFLAPTARLAVSEPPEPDEARWPAEPLSRLGLGPPRIVHHAGVTVAILVPTSPPDPRWPRRTGIPEKRPLW